MTMPSPPLSPPAPDAYALSRGWWVVPPVLFLIGAPLWLHWWEPGMFLAINGWCAAVAAPVWTALSLMGNGWGILGATAPLLVVAPRLMWAWICAAPFAVLFARTGKAMIEFERPAAVIDNAQMRIVGDSLYTVSMPSGHTLTAFAVASAIYFALPAAQRLRHAWLWLLAIGAGLSRIAVGAHWPGDVVVGAALGILAGLLGRVLLMRMHERHFEPVRWSLRLVAIFVAISVYHLLTEALDFAENRPIQVPLALVACASLVVFAMRNARALKAS